MINSTFLNPAFLLSILIALAVHEWAHAYAAYKLGDPTAKYEGRLTLSPIAHLDPIGTLMFLVIGFGWGKPVPVDPRYFKNVKRDTAIVAAAGPFSNLVLAAIAVVLLALLGMGIESSTGALFEQSKNGATVIKLLEQILKSSVFINLALMAFNLLPIAPLDGSKILRMYIPYKYEAEYEQFMQKGPIILIVILLIDNIAGIPILSTWVYGIVTPVLSIISSLVNAIL